MRGLGFPASLALHCAIIASFLFTWSHTLDIADATPVVPVDLVTLADKTDVAPTTTEPPKPEDQTLPQEQPQPAPPQPEEIAPAADKTPMPKPPPPKPQAKPDKFDINNIMALLDKKKSAKTAAQNGRLGSQNIKGIGAQDAMTADLRSLLQSEIYKCWSPPVGAPHPEALTVEFQLYLRRDGPIAQPPKLLATGASSGDPFMRAAVEAARRAIYTCAPYRLPAERYGLWQSVIFVFDPRDMF
jgi:hypothetical protein